MKNFFNSLKNVSQALGLVFGDIGTSPIYTLTVIFLTITARTQNIISVLSMIIWTMILIVTIQYTILAMSLNKHGEGGNIVVNEILKKFIKKGKSVVFFSYLTYIGISLFIGGSVITPAVSILSAVEGLKFIDIFKNISQTTILAITIAITIFLFSFQYKGTEKITKIFGPIMSLWFIVLFVFGAISIYNFPGVIKAINPIYAFDFLKNNGLAGFFILSEVMLCATGAEALYADMGHLRRKPITIAWILVFIALTSNYMGQGAFLALHPESKNVFFEMVNHYAKFLYIPFLVLSILSTIIASQAVISGFFSLFYQGINTRILPFFKIDHTSETINSQIYIGTANWFLFFFCSAVILIFKSSANLAAAYGLTIACTFVINAFMMFIIFYVRKMYIKSATSFILMFIDIAFTIAALSKLKYGAYWSLIIAMIPLCLMILYTSGESAIKKIIYLMNKEEFIIKFSSIYSKNNNIKGTALFFTESTELIPQHIIQTMFTNGIIYTSNIIVRIIKSNEAHGIFHDLDEIADGLSVLKIYVGYMDVLNIRNILKKLKIEEKAIFYGTINIETKKIFWKIFVIIKKLSPTFASFYKLPLNKVCGIATHIKL